MADCGLFSAKLFLNLAEKFYFRISKLFRAWSASIPTRPIVCLEVQAATHFLKYDHLIRRRRSCRDEKVLIMIFRDGSGHVQIKELTLRKIDSTCPGIPCSPDPFQIVHNQADGMCNAPGINKIGHKFTEGFLRQTRGGSAESPHPFPSQGINYSDHYWEINAPLVHYQVQRLAF